MKSIVFFQTYCHIFPNFAKKTELFLRFTELIAKVPNLLQFLFYNSYIILIINYLTINEMKRSFSK